MSAAAPQGTHRCRACAAEVRDGALRCERCGAPQGNLGPCPHCRGEGGISPHAELRFACDLCGGPRVVRLDGRSSSSGREVALLRKADAARKSRATWRGAAVAAGLALVFTVIPFMLLVLLFGASLLLVLPGLFIALFGGLLMMAMSRAAAHGREIAPALDGAWVAVANDVVRQSGGALPAPDLAQKLGIEEPQAEELLALLDVNEALSGVPAPRMRIDAPPGPQAAAPAPAEALAQAAEEEAALGDDAAVQQRKKL